MPSGERVLAMDFDGTIAEADLAECVLRKFADPGWEAYDRMLARAEISLEDCIRKQYAMVRARRGEILTYVKGFCRFRRGFPDLAGAARAEGIRTVVVSGGIDFCIRFAFRSNLLEVPELVAPKSRVTKEGIMVKFPTFPRGEGSFKESFLRSLKRQGARVSFVGDGRTDIMPAAIADEVFAIAGSALETECKRKGLRYKAIDDFRTLTSRLSRSS